MNKFFGVYTAEMLRPILYQAVRRGSIALAAVLLWERFISKGAPNGLVNGTFAVGMIFLVVAWKTYLSMDGLSIRHLFGERKKPKRKHHFTKDIVDFADEHITTLEELTDEERQACTLASSLLLMVLFFLASWIVWLFF